MISSKLESSLIFYLRTDPLRLWYYPRQWLSAIPNIGDEDLRTLLWSYIFLQQHDFTTAVATHFVLILKVFLQRAEQTHMFCGFLSGKWWVRVGEGRKGTASRTGELRWVLSKLLHSYLQIQRSFMTCYHELLKNKLFTFYLNCWHWTDMLSMPTFPSF